jgi:hypothetical protein
MGLDPIGPEHMGPEPSIERERVALVRVAAKLNEIVHKSEAERTGFEPAVGCYPYTDLANRRFRPLSHLSRVSYAPNSDLDRRLLQGQPGLGLWNGWVGRRGRRGGGGRSGRFDGLEVRRTGEDRRTRSPSYRRRSTDWKSVVRAERGGRAFRRCYNDAWFSVCSRNPSHSRAFPEYDGTECEVASRLIVREPTRSWRRNTNSRKSLSLPRGRTLS